MSWKIISLDDCANVQVVANRAIPRLAEFGYTALFTQSSTTSGTITITIDGVAYSCVLSLGSTTGYPTYLMVNSNTNEIVIGQTGRNVGGSTQFSYIASMMLLRGTDTKTGEAGLFPVRTNTPASYFTNCWVSFDSTADQIYLQKALFKKYTSGDTVFTENSFVADSIYWGSALYTPGATIAVGNDTFLCINGWIFAKL